MVKHHDTRADAALEAPCSLTDHVDVARVRVAVHMAMSEPQALAGAGR